MPESLRRPSSTPLLGRQSPPLPLPCQDRTQLRQAKFGVRRQQWLLPPSAALEDLTAEDASLLGERRTRRPPLSERLRRAASVSRAPRTASAQTFKQRMAGKKSLAAFLPAALNSRLLFPPSCLRRQRTLRTPRETADLPKRPRLRPLPAAKSSQERRIRFEGWRMRRVKAGAPRLEEERRLGGQSPLHFLLPSKVFASEPKSQAAPQQQQSPSPKPPCRERLPRGPKFFSRREKRRSPSLNSQPEERRGFAARPANPPRKWGSAASPPLAFLLPFENTDTNKGATGESLRLRERETLRAAHANPGPLRRGIKSHSRVHSATRAASARFRRSCQDTAERSVAAAPLQLAKPVRPGTTQ